MKKIYFATFFISTFLVGIHFSAAAISKACSALLENSKYIYSLTNQGEYSNTFTYIRGLSKPASESTEEAQNLSSYRLNENPALDFNNADTALDIQKLIHQDAQKSYTFRAGHFFGTIHGTEFLMNDFFQAIATIQGFRLTKIDRAFAQYTNSKANLVVEWKEHSPGRVTVEVTQDHLSKTLNDTLEFTKDGVSLLNTICDKKQISNEILEKLFEVAMKSDLVATN